MQRLMRWVLSPILNTSTPDDLREKYQYFTQADMTKWKASGLSLPATSLEDGVRDYVRNYLNPGRIF
jgi:ADP-L-glycero-D-manno-heptose 6-epimerase